MDRTAGRLEKLHSMGLPLQDTLPIGMLVSSIEVEQLLPVKSSIKSLADSSLKWEVVASSPMEEANALKFDGRPHIRSAARSAVCAFCAKPSHSTETCFMNPLNPASRLKLSDK